VSNPLLNEIAYLVQNGFSYSEALEMSPLERRGYVYIIQKQSGAEIDWETGNVQYKDYR
jgi:hypothetical protein